MIDQARLEPRSRYGLSAIGHESRGHFVSGKISNTVRLEVRVATYDGIRCSMIALIASTESSLYPARSPKRPGQGCAGTVLGVVLLAAVRLLAGVSVSFGCESGYPMAGIPLMTVFSATLVSHEASGEATDCERSLSRPLAPPRWTMPRLCLSKRGTSASRARSGGYVSCNAQPRPVPSDPRNLISKFVKIPVGILYLMSFPDKRETKGSSVLSLSHLALSQNMEAHKLA
jgi:hypothetical protein